MNKRPFDDGKAVFRCAPGKPVLSAGSDFHQQVVLLVRPGLVFWGRLNHALDEREFETMQ
jgi:hypothetical protein